MSNYWGLHMYDDVVLNGESNSLKLHDATMLLLKAFNDAPTPVLVKQVSDIIYPEVTRLARLSVAYTDDVYRGPPKNKHWSKYQIICRKGLGKLKHSGAVQYVGSRPRYVIVTEQGKQWFTEYSDGQDPYDKIIEIAGTVEHQARQAIRNAAVDDANAIPINVANSNLTIDLIDGVGPFVFSGPRNIDLIIERVIGSGSQYVYVYYYMNDRKLARYEGRDKWENKIGKSDEDVISRIINQLPPTAIHAVPIIGLLIRTTDAESLERILHRSLYVCGRKIECNSNAQEFYMTSPDCIAVWYEHYLLAQSQL